MADGLIPSSSAMAEDRMANLLTKGNPYMSAARNRSQEYFGGRGLVDSTIAAEAGEKAAIESAMPMVTQDAGTHATAQRDILLHGQETALTSQKGDISSRLQTEQGGIQSTIQKEGAEQTRVLEGERAGYQSTLQSEKSAQVAGLEEASDTRARALEEFTQGAQDSRLASELVNKTAQMAEDNKEAFAKATGPMFQQAISEKTKINEIPDSEMSAASKAVEITNIEQALKRDINFIASIYNYPIYWD